MDFGIIAGSVATLGGLTAGLAGLLAIANRRLHVEEDPRLDEVEEMLPHTNCAACGFPGCRPFAEGLLAGKTEPGKCTVSSPEGVQAIADYLGVEVGGGEKRVARLACAGGTNVARLKAGYEGVSTCRDAAKISGGGKACNWGCLGLADCEVACEYDAIYMDENGLPVVIEDKCVACDDCIQVCPKDLFSLQPVSNQLWVACKNLEEGDQVLEECEVGCTACGKCVKDAPPGSIVMRDNLPVIDYSQEFDTGPIERCPTGAIVWLDAEHGVIRGLESPPVLRRSPRAPAVT